jgi:hypothetical protein
MFRYVLVLVLWIVPAMLKYSLVATGPITGIVSRKNSIRC